MGLTKLGLTKVIDGFEFEAITYPYNKQDAIQVMFGAKSINAYKDYINKFRIEKAHIIMPDLELLRDCPTLKHLRVTPYNVHELFDFSPLYDAPEILNLTCLNQHRVYGHPTKSTISPIFYDRIKGLKRLSCNANAGAFGFNQIETLKSLDIGSFKGSNRDISDLFCSKELDTLRLIQCKVQSLNGIEKAKKLQCLYLDYNRSLESIDSLRGVKDSLKLLRIVNCPKITDFSVLGELENLELLELTGKNELADLSFIKTMKNLKTFNFDMNVKDGDLSSCSNLSYVYSMIDRRHYNLKDAELPKGKFVRGNESIEEWRRLE